MTDALYVFMCNYLSTVSVLVGVFCALCVYVYVSDAFLRCLCNEMCCVICCAFCSLSVVCTHCETCTEHCAFRIVHMLPVSGALCIESTACYAFSYCVCAISVVRSIFRDVCYIVGVM